MDDKKNQEILRKHAEDLAKEVSDKRKSFSNWKCLECEGEPEFEHPAFMEHLKEVHHIDPNTAQGTRRMTMHLDGRDWYSSVYEVVIDGKKFINTVRSARNKSTRIY